MSNLKKEELERIINILQEKKLEETALFAIYESEDQNYHYISANKAGLLRVKKNEISII